MKPSIQICSFLLILITSGQIIRAQTYDLIVLKNGDSIACQIDSVTSSNIYFEMKNNGHWVNTQIKLDGVLDYELDTVNKHDYIFIPGKSIIESAYTNTLQKNSVYLGLATLCYGRTFPSYPISYTVAAGLTWPDGFGIYLESTMLFGKNKHYFETGLSTAFLPNDGGIGVLGVIIRAGYRYQGPKGFLFRSAPTLGFIDGEVMPLPALSLGYSF